MSSNFGTPPPVISQPLPLVSVTATTSLSGLSYGKIFYASGSGGFTINLPGLGTTPNGPAYYLSVYNDSSSSILISAVGSDIIHISGTSGATLTLGIGEQAHFFNKGTFWVADSAANKVNRLGDTMTGALLLPTLSVAENSLKAATTKFVNDLLAVRAYAPLDSPSFINNPTVPNVAETNRSTQAINSNALVYAAPPGEVGMFLTTSAPLGWIKANGAVVSTTTYSDLTTAIWVGSTLNATSDWGYKCTNPSSPTTSRSSSGTYLVLPDMRAYFPRFLDDGATIDNSRAVGTRQTHQLAYHYHTTPFGVYDRALPAGNAYAISGGQQNLYGNIYTDWAGGTSNSSENRPMNIALLACIKY